MSGLLALGLPCRLLLRSSILRRCRLLLWSSILGLLGRILLCRLLRGGILLGWILLLDRLLRRCILLLACRIGLLSRRSYSGRLLCVPI